MTDGRTFAERGFTLQGVPRQDYGNDLIRWMAAHDLNRLEFNTTGGMFGTVVKSLPDLCSDEAEACTARLARLIEAGRQHGVKVVPGICHPDTMRKVCDARPEWLAEGTIPHVTGFDLAQRTLCFSKPEVVDAYRNAVRDLVAACNPDEVQFWLTENRLYCRCAACVADSPGDDPYDLVESYFIREARVLHDCVQRARSGRDNLEISIWTTQGSTPHNVPLVRSLPKDVLWFYYDGERRGCYNLRRRAVIPGDIRSLRAEGYRVGIQLDWASCGEFLTTPSTIAEICSEAADAGLEAVCGWTGDYPLNTDRSRGGAHPVLAYAAEILNAPRPDDGSRYESTMRDAALAAGHGSGVAGGAGHAWRVLDRSARTIRLADSYAYWWHGCNLPGAICERIVRRAPVDELDQRWTDDTWEVTVPDLDAAVADLEAEMQSLEDAGDETGYLAALITQMKLVAAWGRMLRGVHWAGVVFHRMGGWDSSHGPWRDDRKEMVGALESATECLSRAEQLAEHGSDLVSSGWNLSHRLPTMKAQLAEALAAARDGATPSPLPRQDRYPYAPHDDA